MVAILTAYLDEAGTDGRYPFCVVGGYVSTVLKWNDFDIKWRRILKKNEVPYFHTMEYNANTPPYDRWTPERGHVFIEKLGNVILKRAMFGFVVRLETADYKEFYTGPGLIKGLQLDSKYGVCFRVLISFMETILSEHLGDNFKVNVIIESGDKSIGVEDTDRVFRQLKEHIPEIARHFGALSLGQKRDFPGLQAADMTVSPAHKIERAGDVEMIPFLEGETLADARRGANKVAPVYRIRIDGPILKEMRDNLVKWKEFRRDHWRKGATSPPADPEGSG